MKLVEPDPARRDIAVQQARVKRIVSKFLKGLAVDLARQAADKLDSARAKIGKAAGDEDEHKDETEAGAAVGASDAKAIAQSLVESIDFTAFDALPDEIFDPLERAYKSARSVAGIQVGEVLDGATPDEAREAVNFNLVNEDAVDYAEARGAEMVGKRLVDGELVDNPDARYVITDGTRDALRSLIQDSLLEGWSSQQLADQIEDSEAFGYDRSFKIARTEMRFANSRGTIDAWQASGRVDTKEWSTAQDDKVEETCEANADAGAIGLNDVFPSGDDAPPAHPNCRCVIVGNPFNSDEEEES